MKKIIKDNKKVWIPIISFIFLIVLAHSIRLFQNNITLMGRLSYLNAKSIENGFSLTNVYPWLLTPSTEILSRLYPILFSLATIALIILFLKKETPNLERTVFCFLLLFSPFFLYLGLISNKEILSYFFLLTGIILLNKNKNNVKFLSKYLKIYHIGFIIKKLTAWLSILISGLFSFIPATFALIYYNHKKEKEKTKIMIITTIIGLIIHKNNIISTKIISSIISDFGGEIGISIFTIILGVIGLISLRKKQIFNGTLLIISLILLTEYLNFRFIIPLGITIIYYATLGIRYLVNREWQSKFIKQMTSIVIIAGILFSALSYINIISNSLPNSEIANGLIELGKQTTPETIILSHPSRGFWIEYYSKKQSYVNDFSSGFKKRVSDIIFQSRNLKDTKELLKTNHINYIWIDKEMKKGLVWREKDSGLLFLLRNKETFEQIKKTPNYEIWKIKLTN